MFAPPVAKAQTKADASPATKQALPPQPVIRSQALFPFISPFAPNVIQPKLVIGRADDPLEHEADSVANRVMSMEDPSEAGVSAGEGIVRRKCAACKGEDEQELQPKLAVSPHRATAAASRAVRSILSTPGAPLGGSTRAFFEPRFGHDFSAVRIHTSSEAARSARSIGALAYTLGPDIVFSPGRYDPNSTNGRHLLAHELAHTIQQQSGRVVRRAATGAAFGVSEWDARDSELPQSGTADVWEVAEQEENSGPDASAMAKVDGVIQRSPGPCPPYEGYSSARKISSYNCAGLAHRTYDFKSLPDTKTLLGGGAAIACGTACAAGKVKHWLWQYDIHLEDSSGNAGQTWRDFHTVGGVSTGADPNDVYTKNGARQVHGPGTGPTFKPPARDQSTSNDPSETPQTDAAGRPIYKVRQNFAESCHCLNCPSTNPPEQGPPAP